MTSKARKVSFSDDVTCRKFRPRGKASDLFYQQDEYDEIRRSLLETVAMLECGIEVDDTHHCSRGLEGLVGDSTFKKMARRNKAYDAVLAYQEMCWYQRSQLPNEDEMAAIYIHFSEESKTEARRIALRDQANAEHIHLNHCGKVRRFQAPVSATSPTVPSTKKTKRSAALRDFGTGCSMTAAIAA